MDLIQTWHGDRYYCTLPSDLGLDSGHRNVRKQVSHHDLKFLKKNLNGMWWCCDLSHPFSFLGREPYLCDFVKKKNNKKTLNIGLYSGTCSLDFFQTWYDDRDLKLYILISVWMALTVFQGHS